MNTADDLAVGSRDGVPPTGRAERPAAVGPTDGPVRVLGDLVVMALAGRSICIAPSG